MLCRKAEKNMYGQFMRFEFVTMVPIDLDGIDTQYMTEKDVELLNNYHKEVYERFLLIWKGRKEWLKKLPPISNKSSITSKTDVLCVYFHRTSVFSFLFLIILSIKILSGAGAADLRRIPAAYSPPEYFPR